MDETDAPESKTDGLHMKNDNININITVVWSLSETRWRPSSIYVALNPTGNNIIVIFCCRVCLIIISF